MRHFIIIRFHYSNKQGFDDRKARNGFLERSGLTFPQYLRERLRLFYQYTLPSLRAQTCQDFELLMLGTYPSLEIPDARFFGEDCPAPLPTTMTTAYMDYIREAAKTSDYVLMTRLDNDDILMPTYVEHVQKAVTGTGLYECLGYRLDERTGRFYEDTVHHKECTSPFTTLVSKPTDLQNVYRGNHSKMWRWYKLITVPTREWCQVIHTTNWVLNKCSPIITDTKGNIVPIHPFVGKLLDSGHAPGRIV